MIEFIVFYILLAYFTWIMFLSAMSLIQAKKAGTLTKTSLYLGYPLIILGVISDFLLNVASSVVFLEPPKEFLLTHRCNRHIATSSGWRKKLAVWICSNLLDPFQIGGHCKNGNK